MGEGQFHLNGLRTQEVCLKMALETFWFVDIQILWYKMI